MRSPSRSSRRAAFTLVEMIIVIVVLVIAAALVIPSIGSAADSQVAGAARILAADLEMTRSLALTTQQPHSLVFSADRAAYKVAVDYAGGPYAATPAVLHPVRKGKVYEVRVAAQGGTGSVVVTGASFGGAGYVTFDAQGEPSSSGTIGLRAGDVEMIVSVEGLTGVVSVAKSGG